jgi:hypothetical protein
MRRAQQGMAIIIVMALLALGATWMMVSQLNAATSGQLAVKRARNAAVLNQAKEALIGHMAMQALKAGEDDPGRLPCPEPVAVAGTALEGATAGSCALAVGRFPWRTVGMTKLYDADGEPLWLIVSPGWAKASVGTNLMINSDSVGQLTVDGAANAAVALLVAPGAAMNVQASAGCTARNQVRGAPSAAMDVRDFLECLDTATNTYSTVGASTSFNDQVVKITAADLMPALEAAIASRIEREIVPRLNSVYAAGTWGLGGTQPVYPFAAPFASPGPGVGTSRYQGMAATYSGLLPFNQTQGCTVDPANPRCSTTFLDFAKLGADAQTGGTGSIRTQSSCSWVSDVYVCTGQYDAPSVALTFTLNVTNVAMGLRALDLTKVTCTAVDDVGAGISQQNVACSAFAALQSNGSVTITVTTGLTPDIASSGWGTYANYAIRIERATIGDHALLSSSDATTGWFVRNAWFRFTHYAVASGHTTNVLPADRACTTGATCLTVASTDPLRPITPAGGQRAILVLAGATLGAARPAAGSAAITDYLEGGNETGSWVRQPVQRRVAYNDRVVVVGSN